MRTSKRRLRQEVAELRAALVELAPAEVLVEGSYFDPRDLPRILGNYMRMADEYASEAKRLAFQVAELGARLRDQGRIA